MVSYGGEQSLDRYLALSARGIPFNVIHAAGNFTLMLAAGPALIRMLDRYRDRFDFEWRDRPIGRIAACLVVALCVSASLIAPAGSEARAGGSSAKQWLVGAQNKNGGYGTEPGLESSVGMTGWAMLGMEAAGVNPLDVRRAGNTPVSYLRRNAGRRHLDRRPRADDHRPRRRRRRPAQLRRTRPRRRAPRPQEP